MIFDPSKLNLEIDEKESEKIENEVLDTSQEVKKINLNNDNSKIEINEIKNEVNNDVLADLNDVEEIIINNEGTLNLKEIEDVVNNRKIEKNEIDEKNEVFLENNIKEITVENIDKDKIKNDTNKVIYDININSITEILYLLVDKEYDFVTFEADENNVKIDFRKNKTIIDTKYIKYPIYSNILIKTKTLTKLNVEESNKEQEGAGEVNLRNKSFEIISKIIPGAYGEKLFLKLKEKQKKVIKKETKKMSISQIMAFIGAIAFVSLIVGGAFIGFIVLNAKTVEDVKFFAGLGINLNEINNFISKIISVIFSILVFLETILLIILLFKFALTKKEFKNKKIKFGILSAIILILTFSTATAWMIIDQKVKSLPNWQEMALGEIQIYDNSKLVSEKFDKIGSIIQDTSNLIGPVELKFDLEFFEQTQKRKGITINKYIWDFGNDKIIETPLSTIIQKFDKKGITEIKLTILQQDMTGNIIEKVIEDIPTINISYIVNINEKKLDNGGKLVNFDASELSETGRIEWYFMEDLNKPIWQGSEYIIGKPIFEETIVGMYIRRNDKTSEVLDKVFIIQGEDKANLDGKIIFEKSLVNDLEYTFKITDAINDFGAGFIETYKWKIGNKEYTKNGDIINPEKSSEIKHIFEGYGDFEIHVELINSAGNTKTINKKINIPKTLKVTKGIDIYADGVLVDNVDYRTNLNEYFINNLGIPNEIKFDARFIEIDTTLYTLQNVYWDFNSNGDNDFTGRVGDYSINNEGNHTITLKLKFVNRRISDDIIEVEQKVFIEAIRKEAIVDFVINQSSEYVPVIIGFDASRSQVKDSNIVKFIWDYGDGTVEERDAIVPGRRYIEAGEYDIKLTVITTNGKSYTTTKKLILKPKAQTVKIKSSMINAPIYQGIDFTSDESEGQITAYFWNFGDGSTSTQANPTHYYEKAGSYKVKLRLDFANRNVLEDSIDINITN